MHFPFTAIVGQPGLQLALRLVAVDPHLGGVLIEGEKGTAKTTTVRALAHLLPPAVGADGTEHASPFVELPLNATEDRVAGSVDVSELVATGTARLNPGLIGAAHGGMLYVDEVNLLADHLVDILLDAAATGRLTVERDGVSASAPARFALVGTMNPEEGELRPQLLDRFGLSVHVAAPREPAQRVEVMTRRMQFDADPQRFANQFAASEAAEAESIARAREALSQVRLPERELRRIALVCLECEVQGMRADVVTARAAVAHAALAGRTTVCEDDIRAVASFTLPHRRRRDPFDPTGMSEQELDAAFAAAEQALAEHEQQPADDDRQPPPQEEPGSDDPTDTDPGPAGEAEDPDPDGPDDGGGPGPDGPPPPPPANGGGAQPEHDEAPGEELGAQHEPAAQQDPDDEPSAQARGAATGQALARAELATRRSGRPTVLRIAGRGRGQRGRRSAAYTESGRSVPAPARSVGAHLDLPATVRAAARAMAHPGSGLAIDADSLRYALRLGRSGDLVVFLVDTSGSMAARRRLELVAASAVAVLRDAYVRRDLVAVITAGGHGAVTALPPTRSVDRAVAALEAAPTGGRTPLAEGFEQVDKLLRTHRLREPERRAIVVVLTDGRATSGPDARERALTAARRLAAQPGVAPVVVDCEAGRIRLGGARRIAGAMNAPCLPLHGLTSGGVTELVRTM